MSLEMNGSGAGGNTAFDVIVNPEALLDKGSKLDSIKQRYEEELRTPFKNIMKTLAEQGFMGKVAGKIADIAFDLDPLLTKTEESLSAASGAFAIAVDEAKTTQTDICNSVESSKA